jgi:prephenate dehydrogenase
MPQPDKSKKVVDQTGYDPDVRPFTENYQELYREMLVKNRLLYERIDELTTMIKELYEFAREDDDDD